MSLRKNMGSKYQLERDHIFPYSKLKDVGYGEGNRVKYALAQELTNRAILTQVANRAKSVTNAADYLASVKAKFPRALELQCIPEDQELWKIENYEQFLEERRKMLAKHLNAFLEKITATEETVAPVSLEELITEGESDELEFKSTLRWDLKEGVVNKKLEEVIMKTVAAFANSQGGTLLLGVADDGEVLGLEPDCHSLKGADRDKFELHLRNLLNQQFGIGFVTSKVVIKFHKVGDKEVCQIEISPAEEPVIVTVKDKNGQPAEKFFARSGNSSQEIPLGEMSAYIKERFHS
jgi:Putative DNA-binding domain